MQIKNILIVHKSMNVGNTWITSILLNTIVPMQSAYYYIFHFQKKDIYNSPPLIYFKAIPFFT